MITGTKRFLIITLFTLVLIALVNVAWWLYYQRTESLLEGQLSGRILTVARTVALTFEPGMLEDLVRGDLETYDKVAVRLEEIRSQDSLSELFVIDEFYHYLFTTSLEADSNYFLKELNGVYLDSLFFGFTDHALVTSAYRSGQVYLKSAFAPLTDSSGYLVAVLGVEASVDYYDDLSALKTNLYYSSGLSVLGGLLFGVIFLLLQVRLNRTEHRLFLNESHAFMGRMVAVVAHELKNPLMIIRASAERLNKKNPTNEAGYIIEEVDRLDAIATGYLDFARGERTLLQGEKNEYFNLGELLNSIKKHLDEKYLEGQIKWLASPPLDGPEISSRRRSLRQVVMNLLINGVEACRQAGKPIEIGLTVENKADSIQIRVLDHGSGINKKDMKRIFAPFYTTRQSGSGLGLYLSKKIIDEMGGTIEIYSVPGEKTEIAVNLPQNE
ncbi:MAG: sensor histidine kinase [Candidatus Zixiibacteriota bacterium]